MLPGVYVVGKLAILYVKLPALSVYCQYSICSHRVNFKVAAERNDNMKKTHLFWGDTHQNTYTLGPQIPSMAETLSFVRKYLDFYSGAYYTPANYPVPLLPGYADTVLPEIEGHISEKSPIPLGSWHGIRAEKTKDSATLNREWAEFQEATALHNTPGEFVTFPGYEWQGDGSWGDHNVIYKREGLPIYPVPDLPALYSQLRNLPALAIPHHTAYHPGIRAPYWQHTDETISPFAEIYSIHGCSETDEEWVGMRHNGHMGPAMGAATYQSALDFGLHLGAIASTDNWSQMPGRWGHGLMGCWAEDLTRDSLWDAFVNRRVYGVTGDRIQLHFTCNTAPMGSVLPYVDVRELCVEVKGLDALDRIEVLRDGQVLATHNHQGMWQTPEPGQTTRFLTRIEAGWGARLGELPYLTKKWKGEIHLSTGRFLNWWPCWTNRGQEVPALTCQRAEFALTSYQHAVGNIAQEAIVLEYEAEPGALMTIRMDDNILQHPISTLMQGSRILWNRDECLGMIQTMTGHDPAKFERQDPLFYHYAFKTKVHRAIPLAGYTAKFTVTDDSPIEKETHYRIRVEQRNGQRAWSSPIWVQAEE
jgi:hypothetical protein